MFLMTLPYQIHNENLIFEGMKSQPGVPAAEVVEPLFYANGPLDRFLVAFIDHITQEK